jgi:serine/threonine-protein kinase TTK/MPS1
MRIKRVGKVPGSFLSGPARRGRRRQSEEDAEGNGDGEPMISSQEPESQLPDGQEPGDDAAPGFYGSAIRDFASGSPISAKDSGRALHRKQASHADLGGSSASQSPRENEDHEEIPYKVALPRALLPSTHDQENAVPSVLMKNKPLGILADKDPQKPSLRPLSTDIQAQRAASPERPALAAISRNTPHRPAPPPPPKMSVLDAATATAGAAATSQAKQKRNILKVNGKCYTRLDCLGRGGSAKVYRVTAENGKMFALKRVSLENADEMTIKGYKGEIDLLGKLTGVDRVINLFDYEMNEDKKALTLVSLSQGLIVNTAC